ncbi:MAG: hypothetical protein H0U76_16905 [Ktedonobacteraceae bacterium]|nr:hypothetical protein [Ktedonobacteraceae bacterium]
MIHKWHLDTSSGWTWRKIFLYGFILTVVAVVALLGYLFFLRYADLSSSGDANLPIWVGNTWGNIVYFLMSVAFMGFYLWIAIQGTRPNEMRSWQIGALLGVPLGLLSLIVGIIANLFKPTDPLGSGEQSVLLLLGLLACLVAGVWGARREGRVSAGIVAAFWCAFFQVLLIALSTILQDVLFADVLTRTVWSNDTATVCKYRHGLSYQSCEIGDNLGGVASLLVAWPIIGAVVGAISSVVAALFIRNGRKRSTFSWRMEGRAPLIFTIVMIVVFLIEIIGKIW